MSRQKLLSTLLAIMMMLPAGAQRLNNYFLSYLTHTGFSSYSWMYEPMKTDLQRANLKGNVAKVVMDVTDKTGMVGEEHKTDTIFYNTQGNISHIGETHSRIGNPNIAMRPDQTIYEYDAQGGLIRYTWWTLSENINGDNLQQHIHTVTRNAQGNPVKCVYRSYSKEKDGSWKEFGTNNHLEWSFGYDANGQLISGRDEVQDMALTYRNGQLIKAQAEGSKPLTYNYDAEGRLTGIRFFIIDGMDEPEPYENVMTISYDANGNITKATKELWATTEKWVRKKLEDKTTYDFTYTFDEQGNWTKAVMYWKDTYNQRTMGITIKRTLTYRSSIGSQDDKAEVTQQPSTLSEGELESLISLAGKLNDIPTLQQIKETLLQRGFEYEQSYDYFISFTKGKDIYGQATRSSFKDLNSITLECPYDIDVVRQIATRLGYKFKETQEKIFEGKQLKIYVYQKGKTLASFIWLPELNISGGMKFTSL